MRACVALNCVRRLTLNYTIQLGQKQKQLGEREGKNMYIKQNIHKCEMHKYRPGADEQNSLCLFKNKLMFCQ